MIAPATTAEADARHGESSGGRRLLPGGIPPGAWGAIALCMLLVLIALLAPWLSPDDPLQASLADRMRPPAWGPAGSADNILGTDLFGRDILSRLVHGARLSLSVAAASILVGGVLGAVIGIVSGYYGGIVDVIAMRIVDVLLALPTILIAIAIAVALGPSFRNVVIVLAAMLVPRIARQVRGETLAVKQQDYVQYAQAIAVPARSIMIQHILPNVAPTLLVVSTLEIGHVVLLEASLSFLGAGVPPPSPSWGVMVADGRAMIATGWWVALFPGLAILITVLTFNTLGDWLRDHLDPRLRRR